MRDDNFELLKKGHTSALVNIHAQYSSRIFWIGKRLINDEFVIENLVQDSFLKLWMHRDTIQSAEHIFYFLRFVMKRECISYYTRPRNKFYRHLGHLENYENYQDYMAGYDPMKDSETLQEQKSAQEDFEKVKNVLALLDSEKRQLINLCLKYGFRYKDIAELMGTSINEATNEIKKAIQEIRNILNPEKPQVLEMKKEDELTELGEKVLKLRCVKKYSFSVIADELGISQKEVHKAFTVAYRYMESEKQLESA